jgi:hypothetical protein
MPVSEKKKIGTSLSPWTQITVCLSEIKIECHSNSDIRDLLVQSIGKVTARKKVNCWNNELSEF